MGKQIEFFDKEDNKRKYGAKGSDLIDKWESINPLFASAFCLQSIDKYLTRFASQSTKAGNIADLQKSLDYAERALDIAVRNQNIYFFSGCTDVSTVFGLTTFAKILPIFEKLVNNLKEAENKQTINQIDSIKQSVNNLLVFVCK